MAQAARRSRFNCQIRTAFFPGSAQEFFGPDGSGLDEGTSALITKQLDALEALI